MTVSRTFASVAAVRTVLASVSLPSRSTMTAPSERAIPHPPPSQTFRSSNVATSQPFCTARTGMPLGSLPGPHA
ncbi:MAG: hypothetical protein U0414_43530 [Polyangiaceae bacterium]